MPDICWIENLNIEMEESGECRFKQLSAGLGKARLVAVTKKVDPGMIRNVYSFGQRHFGENRVRELKERISSLSDLPGIVWHFIGSLQTNKINDLFSLPVRYLHSVDSIKLLWEIYKKENRLKHPLYFFFQVNTSKEKEKKGFVLREELWEAVEFVQKKKSRVLSFKGLMTMGKIRTTSYESDARQCFKALRELKEDMESDFSLSRLKLSMGMSDDYHIALEEKTDFVRIGRKLFGT